MFKAILLAAFSIHAAVFADVLVPLNANWNLLKGTAAPPSNWRNVSFTATWPTQPAPFYYGEAVAGGTVLSDMRADYTTIYLRRTFNVANPAAIDRLSLRTWIDDAFIVWINGTEVARFNVPAGEPAYNAVASAAIEPTWVTNSLPSPATYLVAGENVIAVHGFNRTDSSDFLLDLQLESTSDTLAPVIQSIAPVEGRVEQLTSVTITFSEPVVGVKAEDFLVNNTPATSVTGNGSTYTFTFEQPAFGTVDITWDPGHQVTDLANPPHPFDSTSVLYRYQLIDETAPFLTATAPPPGSIVRQLSSIDLQFSEEITNIEASDLLINGRPATNLLTRAGNTYVFQFPSQKAGSVEVTWDPAHGVSDVAGNAWVASPWNLTVNPNLVPPQVLITEFLAAAENSAGLKDENGELQDWIELFNSGSSDVDLAGWSLTDDPDEPGLWTFPSVTLPASARLVVFASGKDRKATGPGTRLHTNLKLSSGGEYLALFNAESPRVAMTEFRDDYPEQRNDYSYGLDPNGSWRYFQSPTPNLPNGISTIIGIVPRPQVSTKRGWQDAHFDLAITNVLPGATIRYTTDGTIPTAATGNVYSGPIHVSSNLVLRAAAFRSDQLPSESITHTYLFADQVIRQPNNPAGFPVGPTVHAGYPSDYEMDPEIVNDPAYSADMIPALKALPIVSISLKTDDMFGAANGIYTHPLSRGPQWERPCSVEFIPLDGNDFQEDAGIQIQGNAAREPIKNPKHPFRITFKGDYGATKLDYQMFPDSPVRSFDTLILRADFNYSWLHWNSAQRVRAQRTRDAWMKDTMRDMGGLASHNRYVHLFINGLYWGIYDPTERPDGSFGEAYLGGEKEDYDVINEGAAVDGDSLAYNTLLGFTDVSTPAQYEAIKQYLDMPQFIDYMLLHFYAGHEDWGNNKNWYTIRPRDGSRGFLYIVWDGEMTLGAENANRVNNSDVPSGLHTKLMANAQYRLDFADRVQRHFFNGGALMPASNITRWRERAAEIELPIIAESARWGDYRRDVHQYQNPPYELYTRDVQWRAEQNRLLNNYFPNRTATVLNQLRTAGLYPSIAAPGFSQHGGKISPGFQLTITPPNGTVYYTTNGADPRTYLTGSISLDARAYSGPITITTGVQVKARVFSSGTWSALTEAAFNTGSPRIPFRITEIMYNPASGGDALEYIELSNVGNLPLDVSGYYIEGVDYIFPPRTILAPNEIIILGSSENPTLFAQRYPGLTVFARFGGQLLNRGERLALVAPNGRTIQSVDYGDDNGWPPAADGDGASLEIIDPVGDPDDPANWQASAVANGSPGTANAAPPASPVSITEAQASNPDSSDWLEIYASEPVNIGGWTIREAGSTNFFVFPTAQLSALTYYTIAMGGAQGPHDFVAGFGLDADRETLYLTDNTGAIRHKFTYGPQPRGFSVGMIGNSIELNGPTPRAANEAITTFSTNLKINEILANPVAGESDWIEIYNLDVSLPAALRGMFISISNQVFEITSAAFIAPGGYARFFADENVGPNHLDLKLPAARGTIQLLAADGSVIDSLTYAAQAEATSYGRLPDGSDDFAVFLRPTPEMPNLVRFPVAVSRAGNQLHLQWSSRAGERYRVELSDNLSSWNSLEEVTASATNTTIGDPITAGARYYRVVALP